MPFKDAFFSETFEKQNKVSALKNSKVCDTWLVLRILEFWASETVT